MVFSQSWYTSHTHTPTNKKTPHCQFPYVPQDCYANYYKRQSSTSEFTTIDQTSAIFLPRSEGQAMGNHSNGVEVSPVLCHVSLSIYYQHYSYICPMRYSLTWCNLGRIGGSNFRSSFRRKIMYWTVMWKAVALSIFGFMPGITALKNSAALVMRILRAQRKKALVLIYVEGITWPSGDKKFLFVCWTHQLTITKRQWEKWR